MVSEYVIGDKLGISLPTLTADFDFPHFSIFISLIFSGFKNRDLYFSKNVVDTLLTK
jgi:hypothetical protein